MTLWSVVIVKRMYKLVVFIWYKVYTVGIVPRKMYSEKGIIDFLVVFVGNSGVDDFYVQFLPSLKFTKTCRHSH